MGQQPNKYHVDEDGNIFRVNADGSFTNLGNAEEFADSDFTISDQPQKSKLSTHTKPNNEASMDNESVADKPKKRVIIWWVILAIGCIIFTFVFVFNDMFFQCCSSAGCAIFALIQFYKKYEDRIK